jgi:5-methylcytosine-specific restriction endonuclease McrA
MWTKEFIDENQKLFTLCTQCHSDVENLSKEKFFEKYKREKRKYIFCEEQE